ncbi:MAG: efflux RND transporter periplasmic adaptor subunit [Rubrivivax sp.]|nr:MAG: efflux RND transporter periplasmic adaptor subunit [Rubrivivax sp.]
MTSTPASLNEPDKGHQLRRASRLGLAALILLLGGAAVRVYTTSVQAKALDSVTTQNAARSVLTTRARPGDAKRNLALPGTLRGNTEAAIYARTSGYLQRWTKDIGDRVHKGELLAVIDTPEADQELAQALATREQIKARLALAQSSLARWQGLRQRDAVSQQELDERSAAHQQAAADLSAANANVKRLEQLQSFRRITAPFDGVVVRRNVEVGALIGAGSGSNNRELFYLAQSDTLRVTVAIPQAYADNVKPGQEVTVKLIERPSVAIKGTVARSAGAIDSATRSMQVEIALPNQDGKLIPGAYVEVNLPLQSGGRALVLSVNALQFRQEGPRVAVVNGDRISLRNIKLGRDLGRVVEVTSGLGPKDAVVLNPHDAIEEGERVIAREAPPEKSPQRSDGQGARPASAPEAGGAGKGGKA